VLLEYQPEMLQWLDLVINWYVWSDWVSTVPGRENRLPLENIRWELSDQFPDIGRFYQLFFQNIDKISYHSIEKQRIYFEVGGFPALGL
jgi:hypothetical protein